MVWVTIFAPGRGRRGVLCRAGASARLELVMAPDAGEAVLVDTREAFARLGVQVRIGRRPSSVSLHGPDAA
jgi:hypothetical protein